MLVSAKLLVVHNMLQSWRSLLFLLFGSAFPTLSYAGQSFENSAIVRTVQLGGSLVHVTTTFAVKAIEPNSTIYAIALGSEDFRKTSWLEVKVKGQQKSLEVEEMGFDAMSNANIVAVRLPRTLAVNDTINLVLETVETHATFPWPERAAQNEEQALKYETSLFVLSPYYTVVQRTKIKSPTPRIVSYTTPQKLEDFTLDIPATKSGSTITYGPYNKIPVSNNEFIKRHQMPIVVHYNYDHPVLEVTILKRVAEISHWGANLNIEDEIHLHNAGPVLKGHFSRLEHQSQAFYKRPAPHSLPALTLHLPSGIHHTYFSDLIGNVSTSHLRTAPSVPKGSLTNQYSIFELKPRYPLMGGWNYSFTLGWDSPLADSACWDKTNSKYIIAVPIMTAFPDAVVDVAEVKIVLPEGAIDVEVLQPFSALSIIYSTHTTYLDTIGRPAVTFKYRHLTDMHTGVIYVSYKVPFSGHLKKPLAVAVALLSLFTVAFGARRIDLRIQKK